MNKILDKMAYGPTVVLGGLFCLMPFYPEPHLVEKFKLIYYSAPMTPKDWVDVVLHLLAGTVATAKYFRYRQLQALGIVAEADQDAEPSENSGPAKD